MSSGFWYARSKRCVEIVTSPYGEPPFGGAKTPRRTRCMTLPVGVSTSSGEPTERCFDCAYAFATKAPFAPSSPGVACEPYCQLTVITLAMSPETPVTLIRLPKARPSPARTPETTETPGTFFSAFDDAAVKGEKLSLAVSA